MFEREYEQERVFLIGNLATLKTEHCISICANCATARTKLAGKDALAWARSRACSTISGTTRGLCRRIKCRALCDVTWSEAWPQAHWTLRNPTFGDFGNFGATFHKKLSQSLEKRRCKPAKFKPSSSRRGEWTTSNSRWAHDGYVNGKVSTVGVPGNAEFF